MTSDPRRSAAVRLLEKFAPKALKENTFLLGVPGIDQALGGGLAKGAVHDILSGPAHPAAALAFTLGLCLRASPHAAPLVWIRQSVAVQEAGPVNAAGLETLGIDLARVIFLTLDRPIDLLRAAIDVARSPAPGALILEIADASQKIDLTATRRLALAAEKSGVTVFLVRAGRDAPTSAAWTRWLVEPAASHLQPQHAGHSQPCFAIHLLRQRSGPAGSRTFVEWDSEQRSFKQALHRPVVSIPDSRHLAA
jgi:protein ImuA